MTRIAGLARRVPGAPAIERRLQVRQVRRFQARLAGPRLIRAFGAAFPRAVFVEIGANDGEQHDHLRPMILEHEWRGVMVEPVPYVFDRLRSNYGALARVALENAAIADRDGRLPFYHLAPVTDREAEGLPRWYDGIGSFSREAVLSHATDIAGIEHRLVETEVPCLTFGSLCAKHRLEHVDLILIDTEGYDHEIVRAIDFAAHRPALVVYEHFHLDPADRAATARRMHGFGYETMEEWFDTWCLRPDADEALTATWRTLAPGIPGTSVHDAPR